MTVITGWPHWMSKACVQQGFSTSSIDLTYFYCSGQKQNWKWYWYHTSILLLFTTNMKRIQTDEVFCPMHSLFLSLPLSPFLPPRTKESHIIIFFIIIKGKLHVNRGISPAAAQLPMWAQAQLWAAAAQQHSQHALKQHTYLKFLWNYFRISTVVTKKCIGTIE